MSDNNTSSEWYDYDTNKLRLRVFIRCCDIFNTKAYKYVIFLAKFKLNLLISCEIFSYWF